MFLQKIGFFFIFFVLFMQIKSILFFFDKNLIISDDLNLSPPKIEKGYLVEINKMFTH